MNIAILGFDTEGWASYEYFRDQGHDITICDKNASVKAPDGVSSQLGDAYLENLDRFDLLIRTPGLHPQAIIDANNPDILSKVTSGTNEFFRITPTKNIVGVTGTKGKGTTSTLIAKMLEASGKRVHLGGNIGVPALELLKQDIQPDDWVVLELSSFQLIDLKYSPHIAVCIMVVPEHQDWHKDVEEYYAAKTQLFAHQEPEDIAIYYAENQVSKRIAGAGDGQKIPYFAQPGAIVDNGVISINGQEICKTEELKLLGQHNWQNACAAITAVWQIIQDIPAIRQAATSFTGLPFRIEFRREVHGVRYYNDSFAAAPPAPIAAIEAIAEPKVMILGGFDRQLGLTSLAKAMQAHRDDIRHVLLIGAAAERLAHTLKDSGFTNYSVSSAKDMQSIVREATDFAHPGDAVILSPGFPSFDMFKNFEERGNKFNEAVEALAS